MVVTPFKRFGGIALKTHWFADRPDSVGGQLTIYRQCKTKSAYFGFRRIPFFTKLIDLSISSDVVLAGCDHDTRYDVRRAERDGVIFAVERDLPSAERYYDAFAQTKNMAPLGGTLSEYGETLEITKVIHNGDILVMHYFLLDQIARRVRMLHSASHFRLQADGASRQRVGRSNRYLHVQDMLYFKQRGVVEFDLGGYAFNTADEALKRINAFKDGFGGKLLEESDYIPLWVSAFSSVKSYVSSLAARKSS